MVLFLKVTGLLFKLRHSVGFWLIWDQSYLEIGYLCVHAFLKYCFQKDGYFSNGNMKTWIPKLCVCSNTSHNLKRVLIECFLCLSWLTNYAKFSAPRIFVILQYSKGMVDSSEKNSESRTFLTYNRAELESGHVLKYSNWCVI